MTRKPAKPKGQWREGPSLMGEDEEPMSAAEQNTIKVAVEAMMAAFEGVNCELYPSIIVSFLVTLWTQQPDPVKTAALTMGYAADALNAAMRDDRGAGHA